MVSHMNSSNRGVPASEFAQGGPQRWLVLGGGYCGMRLVDQLLEMGHGVVVTHRAGTDWRTIHQPAATVLPKTSPLGVKPQLQVAVFDSGQGIDPDLSALGPFTAVLSTVPPGEAGVDPVLDRLGAALRQEAPPWVGYLSTSGIYGDQQGDWADESLLPCSPNPRSRRRIRCEAAWRASGLAPLIFRLPGIYGPGRSHFSRLSQGKARLIHKPGQVFSRVHVDDVVGAVLWCQRHGYHDTVVNVSDTLPCPSSELLAWAAHLLDCKLPPYERYQCAKATMGPMAQSFWLENRRVSNRRLLSWGYRLRYPTYREGLVAALAEEKRGHNFNPVHQRADGLLAG